MAYNITQWEGSEYQEKETSSSFMGVGEHNVHIYDATFDAVNSKYTLYLEDVDTGEIGRFGYHIKDKNGSLNQPVVNCLIGLGKALFGEVVGVPLFSDVINGVVHVKVVQGKNYINDKGETKTFLNIYEFKPVSQDTLDQVKQSGLQTIEQYTEG